jgi:hypothetical protein
MRESSTLGFFNLYILRCQMLQPAAVLSEVVVKNIGF